MNRLIQTLKYILIITVSIAGVCGNAYAQTDLSDCPTVQSTKDFYALGTKTGELSSEIHQAEKDLEKLQSRIPDAIPSQQLDKYRQQIVELEGKAATLTDNEARKLSVLRLQVQNSESIESLNDQIAKAKKALDDKRVLQRCVQQRLSSIFSPEQSFKLWMSAAFAFLIGLVIAGFFWLSNKDAIMRRAIFSGQTGIQFLTLFSIVIAIILFGITSILQDKELSALLGGISGYILGRYGSTLQPSASFEEKLASIAIDPDTVTLSSTTPSAQLSIKPKDRKGNELTDEDHVFKPKWESSDSTIATVDQSGMVTRVAPGTCNVTASFNKLKSNVCVVTCT